MLCCFKGSYATSSAARPPEPCSPPLWTRQTGDSPEKGPERASDFQLVTQKHWLVLRTAVKSFSQLGNVQRGPLFSKIYT